MSGVININQEDKTVPFGWKALPQIENLVTQIVAKMGGSRLFYIGAGTSGRLGVVDASECHLLLGTLWYGCGYIAGGDYAIRRAVENAEDNAPKLGKI
jgi:N-acetylmuramic acid 6-phosphate etherase